MTGSDTVEAANCAAGLARAEQRRGGAFVGVVVVVLGCDVGFVADAAHKEKPVTAVRLYSGATMATRGRMRMERMGSNLAASMGQRLLGTAICESRTSSSPNVECRCHIVVVLAHPKKFPNFQI